MSSDNMNKDKSNKAKKGSPADMALQIAAIAAMVSNPFSQWTCTPPGLKAQTTSVKRLKRK